MEAALPGKQASMWVDTAPEASYPPLTAGLSVDVAVVGGGIAGLTTALLLKRAGRSVAVVESGRVGNGVTGHTTGKLSSLHQLIYKEVESKFGESGARTYGQANEEAIDFVEKLVADDGIDCDFARADNFTYAEREEEVDQVRQEAELAARLGLPASFTDDVPLPFPVAGAVRFADQARFHSVKYVAALARLVSGDGSHVFEATRATGASDGDPATLKTDRGELWARDIVVATNVPFLDRGLYFARSHPHRSYVVAARLRGDLPDGMFISAAKDRTLRSMLPVRVGDEELLLVGGEGHKAGMADDITERYRRLEQFASDRFDVASVDYRWATQDGITVDGIPYIGKLHPLTKHLYVATGFRKWGLSNGTVSGIVLADLILGRENSWAPLFSSTRLKPLASAKKLVMENAKAGVRFVTDRIGTQKVRLPELAEGEGRVAKVEGEKVAVYKDELGKVTAVSPVCTHMQCIVHFNDAEKTWDCPCHGSRFDTDGRVIAGPAVKDLERKSPLAE